MASNNQRGPRRMDAGDWTRLKRLTTFGKVLSNLSSAQVLSENPPPIQIEVKSGRRVYTEFGTSRIRTPASMFTDATAFLSSDYVLEYGVPGDNKRVIATRFCDCNKTQSAIKHSPICRKCVI